MSLFDQKEDVLDIEMTPYGRDLYVKGLYSPAYYSFHDDEIIYDIAYTGGSESQTASFDRLTRDCVYLRPQTRYKSAEKTSKVVDLSNLLGDNLNNGLPLGNSSVSSDYKPAWFITAQKGNIETFEEFYENSNLPNVQIPQINMQELVYEVSVIPPESAGFLRSEGEVSFYQNGSFLFVKDQDLLFSIEEANVDVLKENFDIEVYEVMSENGEEVLKPVYFQKPKQTIVNNILLDENEVKQEILDKNLILVDNYFELVFDNEIDFTEGLSQEITGGPQNLTKPPFGDNC
jgi:hypothetical protein